MNILVIGQGGREHAIAWKLQKSEKVTEVFVAPGNGGTELEARCTNVDISSDDFPMIKSFVEQNSIELVVVGPEDPLVNGIKDYLSDSNVLVFGPDAKGAQLEGSKIFSKEFLFENNIPTGEAEFFSSSNKALDYLEKSNFPIVLKADGLAAGKGVLVTNELEEAKNWIKEVMVDSKFGVAGKNILIEECLFGH
jgi:Phosphoribosylamine-glycine ligase